MEALSVKDFAERQGIGEVQLRRVLENPEHYPWSLYGIEQANKVGRDWRITPMEKPAAVAARGAEQLIDGLARLLSSFEESYPMRQVLDDLQKRPVSEVASNLLRRLPPPSDVVGRLAQIAKSAPPPPEVLQRAKPYFRG